MNELKDLIADMAKDKSAKQEKLDAVIDVVISEMSRESRLEANNGLMAQQIAAFEVVLRTFALIVVESTK